MNNEIQKIVNWFKDAKPNTTIEDLCVQIGCHYEEVSEMAETLGDPCVEISGSSIEYKNKNHHFLTQLELRLITEKDRTKLLDDLCDQIFTAVGVGQLAGFDMVGALNEVIRSNDSKRLPSGEFLFDKNGKISKKHDNFSEPDLRPFI